MDQVSQVIMFLVSISDLYFLILACINVNLLCRARFRKKKVPPILSSDEEDDVELLRHAREDRQRRGVSQRYGQRSDDEVDLGELGDPRNVLMN